MMKQAELLQKQREDQIRKQREEQLKKLQEINQTIEEALFKNGEPDQVLTRKAIFDVFIKDKHEKIKHNLHF